MVQRNVDLVIRARQDAASAFEAVNNALDQLAGVQRNVASGAQEMGRALDATENVARELSGVLRTGIGGAAIDTAEAFDRIERSVRRGRDALQQQEDQLRQTESRYDNLQAQINGADAALQQLNRNPFIRDNAWRNSVQQVTAAKRELVTQLKSTGRELNQQRTSLNTQNVAFERLESNARGAAAGVQLLANQQRRLANSVSEGDQRALAQSFRDAARASGTTVAAQQRLAAAFRGTRSEATGTLGPVRVLARELVNVTRAAGPAAAALSRAGRGAGLFRNAMALFQTDTRQSLSLIQRLRGEVLSLTAAFVGFYGIFEQGNQIFQAFSDIEGSQVRLAAAFGGSSEVVQRELNFLRREADRLGVAFGNLSNNYSKFLLAGQQAGLETEDLRDIFVSVTEAGRVLRLSNDQLNGAFVALTQIAGKGTVQMEELRGQLAERVPGAIGILATELGFTSDTLSDFYDLVEDGALDAETALVALGTGLQRVYGDQLADALETTQAAVGRLQNNLFERRLTAANSGFIDGLNSAVEALNDFLSSSEGVALFQTLGRAFENLFGIVPLVIDNFDSLLLIFQALAAVKIAQIIQQASGGFSRFTPIVTASNAAITRFNLALARTQPAAFAALRSTTALGTGLRGLRNIAITAAVGLRTAFAALGGPIGIAITAVTFFATGALADVRTETDRATAALVGHEETVRDVTQAYRDAEGDLQKFRDGLTTITELDLNLDVSQLRDQAEDALTNLSGDLVRVLSNLSFGVQQGLVPRDVLDNIDALVFGFRNGGISAQGLERALLQLNREFGDFLPDDLLASLNDQIDAWAQYEEGLEKAEANLRLYRGEATEADLILLGLKESVEENVDAINQAEEAWRAFGEAILELQGLVPELAREIEEAEGFDKIEEVFQAALDAANQLPNAIERAAATAEAESTRLQALDAFSESTLPGDFASATTGAAAARSLLREREGFIPTPEFDVNAFRVGFGSDTITLSDGSVRDVVQGMRVTYEDALRDLDRRIQREFLPTARRQAGEARFDSFTAQQQGVLTSIAYNYGSLPDRIIAAVRSGTDEEIANAIRSLEGDNDGVNRNRRRQEAAIFARGTGSDTARREAERRLEQQREFNLSLEEEISTQQFLNSLEGQRLSDAEVAKALREAENEAAAVGLELTQEQRSQIEASTRARFASRQAEEDRNSALERARDFEEEVQALQERREILQERLERQQDRGDTAGILATEGELTEVNAQLDEAIQKALDFWAAIGGADSERAILQLQRTRENIEATGISAVVSGQEINDMIADGLGNAFREFSEAVANGENAWAAFRDAALQALGEVLIEIGQAIIQQALLNALTGSIGGGGGGIGGFFSGLVGGLFHSGGIAGRSTGGARSVNMAAFAANAVRYHTGGIAGLRPDEVPAILQAGEEVLTENDPRHRRNGGMGGANVKVVNAVDGSDALEQALSTSRGEQIILNYMRNNRETVRATLEV